MTDRPKDLYEAEGRIEVLQSALASERKAREEAEADQRTSGGMYWHAAERAERAEARALAAEARLASAMEALVKLRRVEPFHEFHDDFSEGWNAALDAVREKMEERMSERKEEAARAERELLREARNELAVIASYKDDPSETAGLRATARAYAKLIERIDVVVKPGGAESRKLDPDDPRCRFVSDAE